MNYGIEYNKKMNNLFSNRLQSMMVKSEGSSSSNNSPKSLANSNEAVKGSEYLESNTELSEASVVEIITEDNIKFLIKEKNDDREEVVII